MKIYTRFSIMLYIVISIIILNYPFKINHKFEYLMCFNLAFWIGINFIGLLLIKDHYIDIFYNTLFYDINNILKEIPKIIKFYLNI